MAVFSNGTEASVWQQHWCDRCLHDHDLHDPTGNGPGCLIFFRTLFEDEKPKVWQPYASDPGFSLPAKIACHAFEPCESCSVPVTLRPPVYGEC